MRFNLHAVFLLVALVLLMLSHSRLSGVVAFTSQRILLATKHTFTRTPTSVTRRSLTTNILVVGKRNGVEPWIANGIGEYEKRLRPLMNIGTIFYKSDDDLVKNHDQFTKGAVILLDETGKTFTSR